MPLLQGSSDSGNHFQALLAETFDGRVEKMLQWLEVFYSTQPAKSIFTQPEIILRHLQGNRAQDLCREFKPVMSSGTVLWQNHIFKSYTVRLTSNDLCRQMEGFFARLVRISRETDGKFLQSGFRLNSSKPAKVWAHGAL